VLHRTLTAERTIKPAQYRRSYLSADLEVVPRGTLLGPAFLVSLVFNPLAVATVDLQASLTIGREKSAFLKRIMRLRR
jgi:hypothetical protein